MQGGCALTGFVAKAAKKGAGDGRAVCPVAAREAPSWRRSTRLCTDTLSTGHPVVRHCCTYL